MRDQSQDHSIITLNSLAVSAFVLAPNYSGTSVHTLLPGSPAPAWQKRGSLKSCLIKAAALPRVSLIPTRIPSLPFFPLFPLWFITYFPTDSIICLNPHDPSSNIWAARVTSASLQTLSRHVPASRPKPGRRGGTLTRDTGVISVSPP